jgi:hypothetical protein
MDLPISSLDTPRCTLQLPLTEGTTLFTWRRTILQTPLVHPALLFGLDREIPAEGFLSCRRRETELAFF